MTNQNEYFDGLQLQFYSDDGAVTVQMLCEASLLTLSVVNRLEWKPDINRAMPSV